MSSTKRKTIEQFIQDANLIHESLYDYSKSLYKNNKTKIVIICKIHGEFLQRPHDHLNGNGCPLCKGTYKFTTNEVIEKSIFKHGNKYDYSLVDYTGYNDKIKIVCPSHGVFSQLAYHHYKTGQGCPSCTKCGYKQSMNGYFYIQEILKDNNLVSYKFGITNKTPEERAYHQTHNSIYEHNIIYKTFNDGMIIYDLEIIVKKNLKCSFIKKEYMRDGYTETINPKDYNNLKSIVENYLSELPNNN